MDQENINWKRAFKWLVKYLCCFKKCNEELTGGECPHKPKKVEREDCEKCWMNFVLENSQDSHSIFWDGGKDEIIEDVEKEVQRRLDAIKLSESISCMGL